MVKTITITDEAYEKLKRLKDKDDSFSRVIIKVAEKESKRTDLRRFLGILSEKEADDAREKIRRIRERLSKDIERRANVLT